MSDLIWNIIASFLSRPTVADWLIARSERTPYVDIPGYMRRNWLFNPYRKDRAGNALPPLWPKLPSIRVHHILRPDGDQHLHDHPWDARTVVLRGWYEEVRGGSMMWNGMRISYPTSGIYRNHGDTARLGYAGKGDDLEHSQFHKITAVSPGGAFTLFITWEYLGTWGFLVGGQKIPYRDYLKLDPK